MRLGIFGGTFNPVHNGHLRTAEEAKYKLRLDKIIFIPAGSPPLKEADAAGAWHRFEMVRIATASNKDFVVSDLEAGKKGKTYTVDTVRKLRKMHPDDQMFFILGIDAFADLPKWRQPVELTAMTDFAVVSRPGCDPDAIATSQYVKKCINRESKDIDESMLIGDQAPAFEDVHSYGLVGGKRAFFVPVTALDISSTGIRRLAAQGKSIKYLVPAAVERHIKKHKLYFDGE